MAKTLKPLILPGVDEIGLIYPEVDPPEGSMPPTFPPPAGWQPPVLPEPIPFDGWHVNVTAEAFALRPGLAPFVVEPRNPRRLFSGPPEDTVALRFADAPEARRVFASAPNEADVEPEWSEPEPVDLHALDAARRLAEAVDYAPKIMSDLPESE